MNKIEIQLSKTKNILMLLGALGFVTLGVLFIITPEAFISLRMRNPQVIRIAGISSVLFFGAASAYGLRKLFDNRIGLTIDENGILDNTNASSIGLIKWTDITKIKTAQVASAKFLLIYVKNPNLYLNMVKGLKRKLLAGNNRIYGTPFSITSNSLKCNFNDLEKLINDRLIEHHARMPNR